MPLQHLWIWEGAILTLVILVDIVLWVLTNKGEDNNTPRYKGLEQYVRGETFPAANGRGSADADGPARNFAEAAAPRENAPASPQLPGVAPGEECCCK